MAGKEYEDAYQAYCQAIKLSPLGPSSHIFLSNRAAALLSLKRYSAASVDARRAITLAPTFGKAHARLGQSLYFLKDFAGAVAAYENAFQFEPDNQVTWTYLNKAKKKFVRENEKRRQREENEFDEEFKPRTAQTEKGGEVNEYNHVDDNNGVNEYNHNHVDDNDGVSVTDTVDLANMAISVAGGSSKDRASAVMGSEGEENADSPNILRNAPTDNMDGFRAAVENDRIRMDRLDETYEEDDVDPDFDEALRLQESAALNLVNKQYRKAVEEFSAALFLVPDDDHLTPQLYIGRAHSLNGLERHEGALNDAMMALGRDPEMGDAHLVLARTYFYLKDYNEAEQSFENAIECLGAISPLDQMYYKKAHELAEVSSLDMDDNRSRGGFSVSRQSVSKPVPKLKPPRFVSRQQQLKSTQNVPSMPKKWAKELSSQGNEVPETLKVGLERVVTFLSKPMGVKLNRGPDGVIRVLSATRTEARPDISRQGSIFTGDILREAAGVDLRRPLTNVMWSDTVALLKIAPRPMVVKVAVELSKIPLAVQKEFDEATGVEEEKIKQQQRSRFQRHKMMSPPSC